MLTNREIASLIIMVAMILFALSKAGIRRSLTQVIKIFFSRKVVQFNIHFLAYAATLIYAAWRVGIWDVRLLKDSVLVLTGVGYPMVFQAHRLKDGSLLFRETVKRCLGASALVALFINLSSLNIAGELILQSLIALLAVVVYVDPKNHSAKIKAAVVAKSVLAIIGFSLFLSTAYNLVASYENLDFEMTAKAAALTIWLPILLLPLIYASTYITQIQLILAMTKYFNEDKAIPIFVKFALLLGLRGSPQLASKFNGIWRSRLAKTINFKSARRLLSQFRESCKSEAGH